MIKSLIENYSTVLNLFESYDKGNLVIDDKEKEDLKFFYNMSKDNDIYLLTKIYENRDMAEKVLRNANIPEQINKLINGEDSQVIESDRIVNSVSSIFNKLNYNKNFENIVNILFNKEERLAELSFDVFIKLSQGRAFSDGNKRTAFIYAMYIASILHQDIIIMRQHEQENLAKFIILYFEKRFSYDELNTAWLKHFLQLKIR